MTITYTVVGSDEEYVAVKFINESGQIYVRNIRADQTAEDFPVIMQAYVDMIVERVARGMIQFVDE